MSKQQMVLIVGSGPSAAYAWMAATLAGAHVEVVSEKLPTARGPVGAFFLHWLPAEIACTTYNTEVIVQSIGTAEQYTRKQWGRVVPSSFPEHKRIEHWWDSRVLSLIWEQCPVRQAKMSEQQLRESAASWDWVFHTFPTQATSARRKLYRFPVFDGPASDAQDCWIVYNGHAHDDWIRATMAFGRLSMEYPCPEVMGSPLPRMTGYDLHWLRDIDPDTLPVEPSEWLAPNVLPIGRFATWNRKALSHDAFHTVWQTLTGRPYAK